MYNFPELIKKIRKSAGLTQAEFAHALEVSPVLVAMIESGGKEVSKKFVLKLADKLEVHPASITPFLYGSEPQKNEKLSAIERQLLSLGQKLQVQLIQKQSKKLAHYAKQ